VSGRRYCSEAGRSYCSWVGTSFLIDLPYINHTQAAKQDAKLWLPTWQKYQNEGQYPRTFMLLFAPSIESSSLLKINFLQQRNTKQ
jgi:hypothetical protein